MFVPVWLALRLAPRISRSWFHSGLGIGCFFLMFGFVTRGGSLARLNRSTFASSGCTKSHRGFQTCSRRSHRPRTLASIQDRCTRLHNAFSGPSCLRQCTYDRTAGCIEEREPPDSSHVQKRGTSARGAIVKQGL